LSPGKPIEVHPANPYYYLFNGQPTVLTTSAEHGGAVIDPDFDYARYPDTPGRTVDIAVRIKRVP
jgi:hypothetical protein